MIEKEVWKVVIEREPWTDMKKVWLLRVSGNTVANCTIIKGGNLKLEEQEEGSLMPDPLLHISSFVLDEIVSALVKEVPPIKKEVVDAELKATKYHLEDLRNLISDKKWKKK